MLGWELRGKSASKIFLVYAGKSSSMEGESQDPSALDVRRQCLYAIEKVLVNKKLHKAVQIAVVLVCHTIPYLA